MVSDSTYLFRLNARKDGVTWNLTGATVTIFIQPRGGATLTRSATITDAAGGVAEYRSAVGEIESGFLSRSWKVVQGDVVQNSEIINHTVADTLA